MKMEEKRKNHRIRSQTLDETLSEKERENRNRERKREWNRDKNGNEKRWKGISLRIMMNDALVISLEERKEVEMIERIG